MSAVPEAGSSAHGRRWIFAGAEFDERTFELRVEGQAVDLEPKPLEVLLHLLRHAGEIVTKEELTSSVWPGRLLTENSLPQAISRIREVLGDGEQTLIKTVHGYGYRFVAPVRVESARAKPGLTRLALKTGDHPPLRPNWTLVRQLGSGGQGEVWLVQNDRIHEQRVFKFALDLAGLAAIKREITLYRFLRESLQGRDEFTRVIEWNLEEAPYYIELEYGAGGNLESWAETVGGLPGVRLAIRIEMVARIADALAAAHSVGVLHKDLKPTNVLITPEADAPPRVKLADFGSGSVLDPRRLEALGITRLGFTESVMQGPAAATAMYLAPEVMGGQPATVQADIYSLGILLYQMVVGDMKQPLAPGWEQRVGDELLCEDIALAVAGDPARRLADAAALAVRLRTLEERRRAREAERAQRLRLEQEQQAATERARKAELAVERLRTRRQWMLTVVSVLIVAVAISLGLYFDARRARNEAAAAAASSKAVADFLSKDLFSVVGEKPLRDLTVQELLDSAAASLAKRDQDLPEVAAQLHAALGNAFFAVERFDASEAHLAEALKRLEERDDAGSEAVVATASQLFSVVGWRLRELPAILPRYEQILAQGRAKLGERHPRVLDLREQIASARFFAGDWRRGVEELQTLIEDEKADPQRSQAAGLALAHLAEMQVQRGEFSAAVTASREAVSRLTADPAASPVAIAVGRCLLARALIELEGFEEAEAELTRAETAMRPWVTADANLKALSVHLYRGLLRLRQGRASDAIMILEPTLAALAEQAWLKSNDTLAEFRAWLANAYGAAGRHAEARQTMQRALEISETQWAPGNPMTQGIRIGLADIVRAQDAGAALRILRAVDRQVLAGLGDHPYVAELHRVEGLLALSGGRTEAARQSLREAQRIFDLRYGPHHALARRARAELAQAQAR